MNNNRIHSNHNNDIIEILNGIIHVNEFLLISINRLMDYTKISEGIKLIPKTDICNMKDILKTVLLCLSSSNDNDLISVLPLPLQLTQSFQTDKQWFQENLLCLLSNAIKFISKENGKIIVRFNVINDSEDGKPMILIEVEDNGIGIPNDMQSKLFAPFQQAHKYNGGTGLGLYSLAQRIIALSGKYGVQNRHDKEQGSVLVYISVYSSP